MLNKLSSQLVTANFVYIIKIFSIKMKEDVGTSKPKKDAHKVGRLK